MENKHLKLNGEKWKQQEYKQIAHTHLPKCAQTNKHLAQEGWNVLLCKNISWFQNSWRSKIDVIIRILGFNA